MILISAFDLDDQMVSDLKQKRCITTTIRKPLSLSALVKKIESY